MPKTIYFHFQQDFHISGVKTSSLPAFLKFKIAIDKIRE